MGCLLVSKSSLTELTRFCEAKIHKHVSYRNSGNFHCHVILVAIQLARNLKMHFYIRFWYKKLKLKTMNIANTNSNENFQIYGS